MSLQNLIDEQLLAEQEKRKTRERSGLWTPGKFGRCYRLQYWSRAKEPETEFPELKMLRRWKVGNLYHDYAQSFFPKEQCEVEVRADDIIGYADIVLEDRVIDVKSVTDWEFGYLIKPNYAIMKEKETNCLQVSAYSWLLNKPKASLWFVNTKSSASLEFDIRVEQMIPKLNKELEILRGYWERKELPPAEPRAYSGKDCAYCDFLTKCKGGSDDTRDIRQEE